MDNLTLIPKKPTTEETTETTAVPSIAATTSIDTPPEQKATPTPVKEGEDLHADIPSLRTFKQDVTSLMQKEKTSLVQIVLEEQRAKRREQEQVSPRKTKNIFVVSLSLIMVLIGLALIYAVFLSGAVSPDDKALEALNTHAMILVEKNKEISIDPSGSDRPAREAIISQIQNEKLTLDTIEYLFFTEKTSIQTKDGIVEQKNVVGQERLFSFINLGMPSLLTRALAEEYMFGIHSFNQNEPFIILTTNYYDNAFAGMLEWEKQMPDAVLVLFGRPEIAKALAGQKFEDAVVKNKDVRVLRGLDGNPALLYSFKDEHTLIITTNEDTLIELSRRLDLSRGKK